MQYTFDGNGNITGYNLSPEELDVMKTSPEAAQVLMDSISKTIINNQNEMTKRHDIDNRLKTLEIMQKNMNPMGMGIGMNPMGAIGTQGSQNDKSK